MTIREGTAADVPLIRALYQAYFDELWQRPWRPVPPEDSWIEGRLLLLAEDGGAVTGGAVVSAIPGSAGHLHLVYVHPEHRRQGVGRALLQEVAARLRAAEAGHVTLSVDLTNAYALEIWRRLGFEDWSIQLMTSLDSLEQRLEDHGPAGPSFASIHVQTDDAAAVERALRRYMPRGGSSTAYSQPRNGWIAVYDERSDSDSDALHRLAREVSNVCIAVVVAIALQEGRVVRYLLLERGSVVDEYLSVPEHFGPLPPGDVVALGANPTAVARLTGADPARLRRVARTATTPDELQPADELLAEIAETIGLEGATIGYAEAVTQPGMTVLEHG